MAEEEEWPPPEARLTSALWRAAEACKIDLGPLLDAVALVVESTDDGELA